MCHNPLDTNSANPIRDLVAGFMCCTLSGIIPAIDWLLVNTRLSSRETGSSTISKSTISYLKLFIRIVQDPKHDPSQRNL